MFIGLEKLTTYAYTSTWLYPKTINFPVYWGIENLRIKFSENIKLII